MDPQDVKDLALFLVFSFALGCAVGYLAARFAEWTS